jgi:hypothetical protein
LGKNEFSIFRGLNTYTKSHTKEDRYLEIRRKVFKRKRATETVEIFKKIRKKLLQLGIGIMISAFSNGCFKVALANAVPEIKRMAVWLP